MLCHDLGDLIDADLPHQQSISPASSYSTNASCGYSSYEETEFECDIRCLTPIPEIGISANACQSTLADIEAENESIMHAEALVSRCIRESSILKKYQILEILGYGTFGVVVKAQLGDKMVAIKIAEATQISSSKFCVDPKTGQPTLSEIAILKYLPPHEAVLEFVEAWREADCWFMVTGVGGFEWRTARIRKTLDYDDLLVYRSSHLSPDAVISASLLDPLRPNDRSMAGLLRACGGLNMRQNAQQLRGRPAIPSKVQKYIFYQLACALRHLHTQGIFHRDIKDENVLVDESFRIHLIDFGHASFYDTAASTADTLQVSFSTYGTSLFCAPEVRSGKRYRGPEADIYAMGLMIYESHFGDLPENLHNARYIRDGKCIFKFTSLTGFSDPLAVDLCMKMLSPDPARRCSIIDVCEHPWFKRNF